MGRMPRLVERGKKDRRLGEPSEMSWEEIQGAGAGPASGADPAADSAWTGGGEPDARGRGRGAGRAAARPKGGRRERIPARAQPRVGEVGRPATSSASTSGAGPGRRGEARIVRATPRLGRRGGRGALSEGAARDLMPRLRGGGRGGARSDRAVEVEGLAGVQEGHRREAEGVFRSGTSRSMTWWRSSWTGRASPRTRWWWRLA